MLGEEKVATDLAESHHCDCAGSCCWRDSKWQHQDEMLHSSGVDNGIKSGLSGIGLGGSKGTNSN